jgi:hypothetical protein
MKSVSAKGRKNLIRCGKILNQVQHKVHDNRGLAFFFCHPEPGSELNSGSNDFGISVLGLENLVFKAPLCGWGSLPR